MHVSVPRVGLAAATIVLLSVILSIHMLPSKVTLKVGDISPENIIAQRTERYIDVEETQLRRAQAAASAGRVYDPVPNAADQAVKALKTILTTVVGVREAGSRLSIDDKAARVRERIGPLLGTMVSDRSIKYLISTDAAGFREIEENALRVVSSAMSKEIREDPADIGKARRAVMAEARSLLSDAARAAVVGELARCAIRPNQIFNEQRTLARQERARKAVHPSYGLIVRGETVIAKGERVLPEHIVKFEALGLRRPKLDVRSVVGVTLLVVTLVWLVVAYLKRFHPEVYASTKALLLLSILVLMSTLGLRIGGSLLGIPLSPAQVGYLGTLWVVTASMFTAVLVNRQVAMLVAAILSIVLSMMIGNEVRYASSALLTALVAIYCVVDIRGRNDLMRAAGAIAGVGVALVWITGAIANDSLADLLAGSFWSGVVVPLVATALFFFGTVPLERPFERTTHLSLLELADTNSPLLRRLVIEAPGTYTHSMAVGHLAENAAAAIGADTLIARVASYYHDIGKLRRPHFFIENQHVENIHDNMNPTLSTLVITSHIKDGIEIAKEYRLPKVVTDVIAQHHGTSLVQYFYSQFTDEFDPSTAVEQQFRYGGPKPQTKEAAIVMLADSVEAASRCLDKPTPAKIEMLVNRVVADRLRDGQLDESELTFKEVSKITASFARALLGAMHARIEYPETAPINGKKVEANADSDSELAETEGEPSPREEHGPKAALG
ncbi:MAG: HD family phosphohydrolase [Armatimonadota bacterium]